MEFDELTRHFKDEEKRRARLGVDDIALGQIARNSDLIKTMGRMHAEGQIEYLAGIRSNIEEFNRISSLEAARAAIDLSPAFGIAQGANKALLGFIDQINKDSTKAMLDAASGVAYYDDWNAFGKSIFPELSSRDFLDTYLGGIAQVSISAQASLANIEFSKVGTAISVAEELRASLSIQFIDFSSTYRNLFSSFGLREASVFNLPPSIAEIPAREFFNDVELLDSTLENSSIDEDEEVRDSIRSEIRITTSESVIIRLDEINQKWSPLLIGARKAFESDNPDKTRHTITSLRELLTQILHYFSPDDEVKQWSQSEKDFYNKKPTRRARLRYIQREIDHGEFTKFIDADVTSTLLALDLFQEGTHALESKLTEPQISALIARIEGLIWTLISIGSTNGH